MIELIGNQIPDFPESFNRKLQEFDRDLYITWHVSPHSSRPGRWKIEQCTKHHGGARLNGMPAHSHLCSRIYVMMVQDDEGTPIPLGEHVFEKLASMRLNSESFGGETERGLRNYVQATNNLDAEMEARRDEQRREIMQHNRKFNRLAINRLNLLRDHLGTHPNR